MVDPLGIVVAGSQEQAESILYAGIATGQIPAQKWDFEVAGHYAQRDVFAFSWE